LDGLCDPYGFNLQFSIINFQTIYNFEITET